MIASKIFKRSEAWSWKVIGLVGALFTAAGSMPQAVALVDALKEGWLVDFLREATSWLPQEKKLYAYFSFLGFQLTPFLAVIAMIYKSADLSRTYARESRFLRRNEGLLRRARHAAASGEPTTVHVFAHLVRGRLEEGVEEWAKGAKIDETKIDEPN